ncbi:C1 family peptidase [Flavobacterium sp.]|uniref:C1 family peptidase n=1 Tax=Flavobacterium sp. TaxID=239 RepID=UPI00260A21C7|nr:C1 family peptidase [Flavobacterium sp.]
MKKSFLSLAFMAVGFAGFAQAYEFQTVKDIEATPVISQDQTGTCWSFSTTSFLEAEIIRITGKPIDLSEMYNVRQTYTKKAWTYVMRQGHAQFGEGGLAHDVINSAMNFGVVPEAAYTGLTGTAKKYNHSKMVADLEKMLKTYADPEKKLAPEWKDEVKKVLDENLGKPVTEFTYGGKVYTPKSFLEMTKLNLNDYVTITSYINEPNYKSFILDIPDNFSNGSFYNMPLDEFMQNIDNAIDKGYTLALDIDVSEPTFSAEKQIAVLPADDADKKLILTEIKPEKQITPDFRQAEFENFDTTDDHLMHIVGKVKDQKGNVYYKVKNSWGTAGPHSGFVYMSVPYVRLKAISVLLHKGGLLKKTRKELGV